MWGVFFNSKKYSTLGIRMIFDQQICVPCSTLSDTNNRQAESALCLISLVTERHVKAGASCRQRHQHRHSLEGCLWQQQKLFVSSGSLSIRSQGGPWTWTWTTTTFQDPRMFLPLLSQLWVLWAPCRILHQVPRALCGANQSKTALSLILVRPYPLPKLLRGVLSLS